MLNYHQKIKMQQEELEILVIEDNPGDFILVNEYLEDLIFQHGKINGVIPPDEEPLGETRGGKRDRKKADGEDDRK